MANYTNLNDLFTGIANAIRLKNGTTATIIADNFPTEIENLRTGFDYVNPDVTEIPDYAFYGCEDLNSADCYNLTSVGVSAFENCTNLKSVILYDGVESVGENAFKECSEDLIICCETENQPDTWHENWNPDNRLVIWGTATSVNLIETWDVSATEEDNVTAMIFETDDEKYILIFNGNGNMKNFNIYGNSNKAPWSSLYGANLTSVVILDDVTSIGSAVFRECTGLKSITIPNSVTSIGSAAFRECTGLKSITIPNSVTSIGDAAFKSCGRLTSIIIPDSVTSIGQSAFKSCGRLTSITYTSTISQWNAISFGEGWDGDDIGDGAMGNYTIHCTDGDIAKDGTITYHTTT